MTYLWTGRDSRRRRRRRNNGTLLLDSGVRKRKEALVKSSREMDIGSEESPVRGEDETTFTASRDLAFRDGEWRERNVVETAVVVTEPRAGDKRERDEGDSGISETAAEEYLLSSRTGSGGGPRGSGGGGGAPDYGNGKRETALGTLIQVFIPFMIAGFGMMAAGLLLDEVQHWDVYSNINEIFILVPALLGLKGNLEMTLASRLSTAANMGQLDSWRLIWRATWGNLSLIQGQALVVAALATAVSIIFGRDLHIAHMLLLGASSMSTASIASAALATIMIIVIVISYMVRINPDNIATPIAASLGDLVTLGLLSVIARWLYDLSEPHVMSGEGSGSVNETLKLDNPAATITVSSLIMLLLLCLIPLWLYLAFRNSTTRSVLYYGWVPVIAAMCISSGGGLVLSQAVSKWKGIAIYSPIINGVGGNLVAVQASRISTSLHTAGHPGRTPDNPHCQYNGPMATFFSSSQHSTTAKLLVFLVVPGSAVFLSVIHVLNAGHTTLSPMFFIGYIICAVLQVCTLLMVADWLVHKIWFHGFDPDNIAIPFLTALGDLLGTGLLALGFQIMWYLGDRDEDVGE